MGENHIKVASFETVPPYRYGVVNFYNVPITELDEINFKDQLSAFNKEGLAQSPVVIHPSQQLGANLDFNGISLERLLIPSGNFTKDTMLLFSLLKTVPELKKAWGKMHKSKREGALKVFRMAMSEAARAWKDDIYYEAITMQQKATL